MSMFEDNHYRWRETYFVLFDSQSRPALKTVEKALATLNDRYELSHGAKNASGRFESLTVVSPDDFSALDICYTEGDEVREQVAMLAEEMRSASATPDERSRLQQLKQFDARFEILHFEQVSSLDDEDDELDEALDPSALLLVLGALSKLTGGIAIDPQAGTMMSGDE